MKEKRSLMGAVWPFGRLQLVKKRYFYLLVLLTFLSTNHGSGQALQIGNRVPDVTVTGIVNFERPSVTLSDFKGRLLILDFWVTWCSPCVAAFPKMDSLRTAFGSKLFVLPVSGQPAATVSSFLKGMEKVKGRKAFSATGDTRLKQLFPHQQLPHYVWINGEGIVVAITDGTAVTAANIQKVLEGKPLDLKAKQDSSRKYDQTQPLLCGINSISQDRIVNFHALTRYVEGYPSLLKCTTTEDAFWSVVGLNLSLAKLYQLAYSEFDMALLGNSARLKVLAKDSLNLTGPDAGRVGKADWLNWFQQHAYCYEARQAAPSKERVWQQMRQDLDESFPQLECKLEKQKVKCLILKRTTSGNLLASKGGKSLRDDAKFYFRMQNTPWAYFISRLQVYYLQTLPTPLLDETGLAGPVDLEIEANLYSVSELRAALARYGLTLIEEERDIAMIVIRDRESTNLSNN